MKKGREGRKEGGRDGREGKGERKASNVPCFPPGNSI